MIKYTTPESSQELTKKDFVDMILRQKALREKLEERKTARKKYKNRKK